MTISANRQRRQIAVLIRIISMFLLLGAVRPILAAEVELNGQTFQLLDGFTIELVASPPVVERPICADFDELGRLYVADSSGSNDPVEKQLELKPHRIFRLEDTDGDGQFDKRVVFADRMMFPEGTLWFDGSLYVAAPPSIWKLTDTDDDGVADLREEWFQGKTLTHCANDLHGPYLGPDGWFYWCKGAFAEQAYERPGKTPFVTQAAHIFRCRPDAPRDPETGSVRSAAIEPVMTGGMANPVDVVFTAGGERIFTTTFLIEPRAGLRDGLIHAVYGGVYGRGRAQLDQYKRTGDLMPVLRHLGPAVPCGLTRYQSRVFGPEFKDNLFTCLFNLHKVTRHVLTPHEATYAIRDEDFLISNHLDFHPTDVLEDADGSVLVIDTGGWYKLCCPSSQLWKPDVLGAIYRIRRAKASRIDDPRGLKIKWTDLTSAQLAQLLEDPRPALQNRAIHELAKRGAAAVEALQRTLEISASEQGRCHAVWALTRIDHPSARGGVRIALADPDETVRQAAIHSVSVWRDADATADLLPLLASRSLHNRRAAAEALGRIGDGVAVPALLAAASEPHERNLEHSLIYALIEIANAEKTAAGLTAASSRTRRAALMALDQMNHGMLTPSNVVPLLSSDDRIIAETATWIVDRHPDWGTELLGYFGQRLQHIKLASAAVGDRRTAFAEVPAALAELEQRLARCASDRSVQQFLGASLSDRELPNAAKTIVLRAMAQSALRQIPLVWTKPLTDVLNEGPTVLVQEAVSVLRRLEPPKTELESFTATLLNVARQKETPVHLRLEALASVPKGLSRVEPDLLAFLCQHLEPDLPISTRSAAADILAKARLDASQLVTLADRIRTAGPLEIDRMLAAFEKTSDEHVGRALIAALKDCSSRSALREESLKPRLAKFPTTVRDSAIELYALLRTEMGDQEKHVDQLLSSLPPGDVRRGQQIFHSSKAACAACHSIGYLGGDVGPDLTRIARIRTRRALLEAIVYPSATLLHDYLPVVVATVDGKLYNGLVKQEARDEVVLATGPNQQVRIFRDEIEEMRPSNVSVMPAGLDKQLTPYELADLVEFLSTAK